MRSPDNPNQNRGIRWLAIVRTLLVQVLVLLALSAAISSYLSWSSNTAWAEFTGASKPSVSEPESRPQSSAAVHAVKGQTACYLKG